MNSYAEMRSRHQKEMNAFPLHFAFSEKQIREEFKKMGLDYDKKSDCKKVVSIGAGGFVRREDLNPFKEMIKRHEYEIAKAITEDMSGNGFIYDMFVTELENHEYSYTGDMWEAVYACGLNADDLETSPALRAGLAKACKHCMRNDW